MEILRYMEIFQDMEIILDMEVQHHKIYRTTIGIRKNICHMSYKLYAYALQ